jgi:hypothetical protein
MLAETVAVSLRVKAFQRSRLGTGMAMLPVPRNTPKSSRHKDRPTNRSGIFGQAPRGEELCPTFQQRGNEQ